MINHLSVIIQSVRAIQREHAAELKEADEKLIAERHSMHSLGYSKGYEVGKKEGRKEPLLSTVMKWLTIGAILGLAIAQALHSVIFK